MQTRTLGRTDLSITPIGFGAWAIGGSGWAYAWGAQDDAQSIAAIHRALDLGINWIDTAAVYGLGHSEEVVARAVRGWSGSTRPYIFTKCSMVWDEKGEVGHSLKADSIRRECEASLRRLQTDVIDLYQIHWPNPEADIEEGWTTLAELQREGKVRHIGVSNFSVEQMRRAEAIAPIASLQPPLLHPAPRHRGRDPSLLRRKEHRRHRLLPHGLRPADRRHDPRAGGLPARGRLAAPQQEVPCKKTVE